MSTTETVERDERTIAVENASYRMGYAFLAYALLADVMYRSFVHHEAPWDLMALVIAGGAVCTAYQFRHRTLTHGWIAKVALGVCIAAVVAAILALAL